MRVNEDSVVRTFLVTALSLVIDSAFFGLWAAMNFGLDFVLNSFPGSNPIDGILMNVLRTLFAIFTAGPIFVFLYRDIRIALLSMRRHLHARQHPTSTEFWPEGPQGPILGKRVVIELAGLVGISAAFLLFYAGLTTNRGILVKTALFLGMFVMLAEVGVLFDAIRQASANLAPEVERG
jgi:hypothetical protein